MKIEENIRLAPFTTFKIGGPARYFCFVKTNEELKEALSFAKGNNLSVFMLGGGSNILIGDRGFDGLVIKNDIKGIFYNNVSDGIEVKVGAGEIWDDFVADTINKNHGGLENLSGIPGSVGAAPVQNIGAYGKEVAEFILSIDLIDLGEIKEKTFSNNDCHFGYRDSIFKNNNFGKFFVTYVTFKLPKNYKPDISYKDLALHFSKTGEDFPNFKKIRETVLSIRAGKMPKMDKLGTAGSFFKNPIIDKDHLDKLKREYPLIPSHDAGDGLYKVPLAWILDNILSLKGHSKEGARLYEKQPLIMVAESGTKAESVLALALEVEEKVFEKTGIKIEKEVFVI